MLDNLNTHFRKCFDDVLGSRAATQLLRRVEFHYTPKHASWLNMAEIEIGILSRQCLDRRIANLELLESEVAAWQQVRNDEKRTIEFPSLDKATRLRPPNLWYIEPMKQISLALLLSPNGRRR